jgi:hypothetical protein
MIQLDGEHVVTFQQAVSMLPKTNAGRNLHPHTLWRWAKRGLKGPNGRRVLLETVRIGGRNCTSIEALQRFFERLTPAENSAEPSRRGLRPFVGQHLDSQSQILNALEEIGIKR